VASRGVGYISHHFLHKICLDRPDCKHANKRVKEDCRNKLCTGDEDESFVSWNDDKSNKISKRDDGEVSADKTKGEMLRFLLMLE
jgi:hypothetical protein